MFFELQVLMSISNFKNLKNLVIIDTLLLIFKLEHLIKVKNHIRKPFKHPFDL